MMFVNYVTYYLCMWYWSIEVGPRIITMSLHIFHGTNLLYTATSSSDTSPLCIYFTIVGNCKIYLSSAHCANNIYHLHTVPTIFWIPALKNQTCQWTLTVLLTLPLHESLMNLKKVFFCNIKFNWQNFSSTQFLSYVKRENILQQI